MYVFHIYVHAHIGHLPFFIFAKVYKMKCDDDESYVVLQLIRGT